MDLLEFARGPALQVAAYILVAGVLWRLVGIILLKEKPEFSEPRKPGGLMAALKVIYTRSFTASPFKRATLYPKMLAYVLHIGLFVVVLLFVPHIVFFEGFLGFGWPGLPNNVIYIAGVAAVVSGVALLVRRGGVRKGNRLLAGSLAGALGLLAGVGLLDSDRLKELMILGEGADVLGRLVAGRDVIVGVNRHRADDAVADFEILSVDTGAVLRSQVERLDAIRAEKER